MARFLGKEVYGEYGTIRNTLMNIAIFSTFGLGYTATKYIAENKMSKPELLKVITSYTMKISFTVSAILSLILFFTSSYVATIILEAPHLTSPLRILSLWIIFNSVTTAQIGILSGLGAFKEMAKINAYVGTFAFLSSVALTYYWNLNGALLALLFTQILNWYLNYREVKRNIPDLKQDEPQISFLREMFSFSFPVALQEGLYSLTSWLTILILIKLSDYGQVGLYSAAIQWSVVILFIPGILRNVILTHMADANEDQLKHKKILKHTLLVNFVCTFIPFLLLYFSKSFVVRFYGESYSNELENILAISLFSTIFISVSNVYSQAYMSKGRNWLMFNLKLIRSIGVIAVTGFLILSRILDGAYALVTAILIMQISFLGIISFLYHKLIA